MFHQPVGNVTLFKAGPGLDIIVADEMHRVAIAGKALCRRAHIADDDKIAASDAEVLAAVFDGIFLFRDASDHECRPFVGSFRDGRDNVGGWH